MSNYCTFKLGGKVKFYITPSSINQLVCVIELLDEYKLSYFVLGNGSNVLFRQVPRVDVVISLINLPKILYHQKNTVCASANIQLFQLHKYLKENGLRGLEFCFGIPATVGGAIKCNAGAFDDCICEHLIKLTIFDTKNKKIKHLNAKNIKFCYRQTNIDGIILNATFKIEQSDFFQVCTLQQNFIQKRLSTQPYNYPSAGSIFKRDGKIIPSLLIDKLGLKGTSIGGAAISKKHAGFIIKTSENCTSQDVLNLIKLIKKQVKKAYDITLQEEIVVI